MELSVDWLQKASLKERIDEETYILEREKKLYLVLRGGACNPKKCLSACCKLYTVRGAERDYDKGFCRMKKGYGVIDKKCRYLKNNRCARWKKKGFPNPCRQFPHPTDQTYFEVAGICSFNFYLKGELTKVKE